jgi:3-oxoacyl-[acyl-carrier protein] reductase
MTPPKQNKRLEGKTALVTGASRGIGRAIAQRLARDGAKVIVNFVAAEKPAQEAVAAIQAEGGQAVAIQADVTVRADLRRLFEQTVAAFGTLDILVNNAGYGTRMPMAAVTEEIYDRIFSFTKATFFAQQLAADVLADNGRIINLSTGITRGWAEGAAVYGGSKAAIEMFTRSQSKELGKRGITVNAVLPGVTQTELTDKIPAAVREDAARRSSFGRIGEPDDIADIVAFLASHDARWITGQMIVANGGMSP